MEHIAAIINGFAAVLGSIAWPLVILVIFFSLKKPILNIFPSLKYIKYKDFEMSFRKALKMVAQNEEIKKIDYKPSPEEHEQMVKLAEISPASAVIEAWKAIEYEATKKIKELIPNENLQQKLKRDPLRQLAFVDALEPDLMDVIWELKKLRNQAAHSSDAGISKELVLEYITLSKTVVKKISEISSLPKQRLFILTMIVSELSHLIDTGKYNDITVMEIHEHIEQKDVITFLKSKAGDDVDFSILLSGDHYRVYLENYNDKMLDLFLAYGGDERRRWGVENSGLCLLVSWTNELIKQGSGWSPTDA